MVPTEGQGVGLRRTDIDMCWGLFEFVMGKWHNCRMYEYTRGLTDFRKELKQKKKAASIRDDMSLRDQIKAMGGSGKGRPAAKIKKAPLRRTQQHRDRAIELARRTGSSSWHSLTTSHLQEYIEECGVKPPSSMKKCDLQSLLRSLAPGIGLDPES